MLSWLQTPTGEWHTGSILTVVGWLSAGIVMACILHSNMKDRISTYQTTPRTLSADKVGSVIAGLKNMPKQAVIIYAYGDESGGLAGMIQSTLQKAGFEVGVHLQGEAAPFHPPIGLSIWTLPGKKLSPTAAAILQQLSTFGARQRDKPTTVPEFDGITIAIGPRA